MDAFDMEIWDPENDYDFMDDYFDREEDPET